MTTTQTTIFVDYTAPLGDESVMHYVIGNVRHKPKIRDVILCWRGDGELFGEGNPLNITLDADSVDCPRCLSWMHA